LTDVVVDRDHTGAASCQTDGGVALSASEIEDASAGDVADEAALDVGADPGTEVDRFQ